MVMEEGELVYDSEIDGEEALMDFEAIVMVAYKKDKRDQQIEKEAKIFLQERKVKGTKVKDPPKGWVMQLVRCAGKSNADKLLERLQMMPDKGFNPILSMSIVQKRGDYHPLQSRNRHLWSPSSYDGNRLGDAGGTQRDYDVTQRQPGDGDGGCERMEQG